VRRLTFLTLALLLIAPSFSSAAPSDDERVVRAALDWLNDNLADAKASGSNASGSGKRIVALAAAGYVLAVHPDWKGYDDLRATVRSELNKFAAGGGIGLQETWLAGVAAATLTEERLRGRDVSAVLRPISRRLEEGQNFDGGWAHGSLVSGNFYPSTLVAATNLSLFALAAARDAGVDVDGEVIDKGLELLRSVQAPNGAFPYGGPRYRKGLEAGRTASAVVALAALAETRDGMLRRAAEYVHARAEAIPNGHASPAMHAFFGALACRTLGEATWARFDAKVLDPIRRARRRDGAFESVSPGSPDSMGLMGTPTLETAYVTALHAAALSTADSKLVGLLRDRLGRFEPRAAKRAAPVGFDAKPIWRAEFRSPTNLDAPEGRPILAGADGTIGEFSAKTGVARTAFKIPLRSGESRGHITMVVPVDATTIVVGTFWSTPGKGATVGGVTLPGGTMEERIEAFRVGADGATSIWVRKVPGRMVGATRAEFILHLMLGGGGLHSVDLRTGTTVRKIPTPSILANGTLVAAPDGRIAVAAEKHLVVYDAEGEELWERQGRQRRGITAPSWGAATWLGDRLVSGRTDGRVSFRDGATGKVAAKVELASSVSRLVAAKELVIASTSDGRLHGLRPDGSIAWSYTLPSRRESHSAIGVILDGDQIWMGTAGAEVLVAVDVATGKERRAIPLAPGTHWAVGAGRLYLAIGDSLTAYSTRD